MRTYVQLLGRPGFAGLFFAQLVARAPVGIWSIGLLLYAQERTGSYAAAGVVTAMLTVGRALGTPAMSRAVDRWGPRRVLAIAALGSGLAASAVVAIDLSGESMPLAIVGYGSLTMLSGLLTPPIQPVVRALFPRLLPPGLLARAFSLDAAAQEVIFVLGPLAAFGIAAGVGPSWTVLAGVVLLVAGTGWILTVDGLDAVPRAAERARFGSVLARPVVLTGTLVCLLLVAANSAVEAGMVAAFGSGELTGGVLLAVYSATSMVGGLALARFTAGRWAQAGWLGVVALGLGLTAVSPQPGWLAVALGLAGVGVAPVFAAVAWQVSTGVPEQGATEAFGWVDSGAIAGASLGFAAAGIVIEAADASGALMLAAGLAGAACLLALAAGRTFTTARIASGATD
ncbi:MAG: MFS transporter [Phenylobacterium zucineum]|nr:MAG: MFS transporter [Phenylobacterium zucineum]